MDIIQLVSLLATVKETTGSLFWDLTDEDTRITITIPCTPELAQDIYGARRMMEPVDA